MIKFKCPHCNHPMEVPDDEACKKGTCKKCDSELTVPARRKRKLNLSYSSVVATIALLLSLYACFRNPLGSGLDNYDLSTPKAALTSSLAMFQTDDVQARMDFNSLPTQYLEKEKLSTLKIHKLSDYQSDKLLWVSFDKNGIRQFDIEVLRKEPVSGLWYVVLGGRYRINDSEFDKAEAEWISKSGKIEEK